MRLILIAWLAVFGAAQARADAPAAGYVTPTVSANGVDIRLKDLILTPRPGKKVFVLWDAFNYRQVLADKGPGALTATATGLAKNYGLKSYPKSRLVHVSVVEYQERDSYDMPRYESMKELAQFEFPVDPKTRKLGAPKPAPQ